MNDYSNSPVLLIYDTNEKYDYDTVQQWFHDSRFNAYEAADVFEAIQEMSDFTMQHHPDVILLKISSKEKEYSMIQRVAGDWGLKDFQMPIALLSDAPGGDDKCPYSFGNLRQLKAQLDLACSKATAKRAGGAAISN